jgi:hypothetical protein
MIEDVLPQNVLNLIDKLAVQLGSFYLAGGMALALQLGHRVSEDLDFFINKAFDAEELKNRILPDKVSSIRSETLHCVKDGVRLSFLFYDVPLCFPPLIWRGIQVAACQDVAAEKLETISQRGAKDEWSWDSVRSFFETHLREFEIALTNGIENG